MDNPRVKAVVKLGEHRHRRQTGLFVAQGEREIARAAAAGLVLAEVYECPEMTQGRFPPWEQIIPDEEARENARWHDVTPAVFAKMSYKDRPEGALAVFEQPKWTWEELALVTNTPGKPALYMVAAGLEKPGNLGAMARSAAAAGADALLVADGVVDAFNPNAIRASTGAVFGLPILSDTSASVIAFLKKQHVSIYPASPDATQSYTQVDMTKPCALVIGAEDVGLDHQWLDAGKPITIHMNTSMVDSLNASIAAGVLLFEALRQRAVGLQ